LVVVLSSCAPLVVDDKRFSINLIVLIGASRKFLGGRTAPHLC
jgi:hypothetical protein